MLRRSVSHFEVEEKVGEGGMGEVYKARDTRLDRIVALKFLSGRDADSPEERQRFLREARTLSTLSHPNVATVYEVDEENGTPFLVMEYLPGGTLRGRIEAAKGRVPVSDVLRWAEDLTEGLAHAHRRGIVHRDVKSSNVMFDAEGRAKLTDFGLARTISVDPSTRESAVAGTIGYMAPERLRGNRGDFRSDLFSFGVVLYEAATGRLPFQAPTPAETIHNVLNADPEPLTAERPDFPPAFEAIVERLLRKRPDDRFQSADDVTQSLKELPRGPHHAGTTLTLRKAVGRWPRRWWAAVALACLLVLVWAGSGWVRRWTRSWRLPERRHVAVLSFRNIGGGADQQAFCDGLTETVTTALTRHGSFSVVPAGDARRIEDAESARREFGVNLVVAGTVQRRGENVRVIIHLIDASRRRQIDSEQLDLPVKRLFELEDGVLGRIADLLNVVSSQREADVLASSASQVVTAHDAYLRGRGFLYRWDRPGNLERALQEFDAAVRQDPKFALGYVGLAEAQFRQYSTLKDPGLLQAAGLAAQRALELNPRLAGAHAWRGRILAESDQQAQAAAELEEAVKLDPRDPAAMRELARVYEISGRPADAERVFRLAVAARPGDWMSYSGLGAFYAAQQRHKEAESQYRKVLELTPDNPFGYRNLAAVLIRLGNAREAEQMLRKALELRPLARTYSNLGALLMFEGRYADAVPAMERAAEIAQRETPRDYRIWGNLGDAYWLAKLPPEKAQSAWRRAVEIAAPQLTGRAADAELLSLMAKYHAKLGDRENASKRIAAAITLAPSSAMVRYQAGLVFALIGNHERALAELDTAAGLKYSIEEIRQAPELAPLHQNRKYQELIRRSR